MAVRLLVARTLEDSRVAAARREVPRPSRTLNLPVPWAWPCDRRCCRSTATGTTDGKLGGASATTRQSCVACLDESRRESREVQDFHDVEPGSQEPSSRPARIPREPRIEIEIRVISIEVMGFMVGVSFLVTGVNPTRTGTTG